jgi:hypothetical protein
VLHSTGVQRGAACSGGDCGGVVWSSWLMLSRAFQLMPSHRRYALVSNKAGPARSPSSRRATRWVSPSCVITATRPRRFVVVEVDRADLDVDTDEGCVEREVDFVFEGLCERVVAFVAVGVDGHPFDDLVGCFVVSLR